LLNSVLIYSKIEETPNKKVIFKQKFISMKYIQG